ncbi:MAG: adenylate/guanylate cyclase domain-containing protein [Spirochaetales bacterium]|nr:adenylate/guanylate cyclase domain-containing protein [Spirochaetales bacterium]
MTIRSKVILIVLPLLAAPLILTLIVGVLSTRNGITHIATKHLSFKSGILIQYIENQWHLLEANGFSENPDYLEVSKKSVEEYAGTLIENSEELIFALTGVGELSFSTSVVDLKEEDVQELIMKFEESETGWVEFELQGLHYVSDIKNFDPFGWTLVNAVEGQFFFGAISTMVSRILIIFVVSLVVSIMLLVILTGFLTRPLKRIDEVIRRIIESNDLSARVDVVFNDEIGEIGHYFNLMTRQLEVANDQMKNYALKAVISKRNESKIRNIFQKYVPKSVIDRFYEEPESMLEGDSRVLGILFSDIRQFTTFSEKLPPHEVVESLNKYFEFMVDSIIQHNGIVDKYIGDAIMAFFGAPVHHDNDALETVNAGLEMIDRLTVFNEWQIKYGRNPFQIGVGINYGYVTVGNIGTEKKMDYTVIGDMVNLASRLEGLTKMYHEPILISESVYKKIEDEMLCRQIDRVVVKGKTAGSNIYTVKRHLTAREKELWLTCDDGLTRYYNREFTEAEKLFKECLKLKRSDHCSKLYIKRCREHMDNPPGEDWTGAVVLTTK